MKTLLLAAAVSFSISATAEQHTPQLPDCPTTGGCDFVVGCTISNGNGERGMFRFSQLSYPIAASMFGYTENAIRDWYADLRELLQDNPRARGWVPDPESPLTPLLEFTLPSP